MIFVTILALIGVVLNILKRREAFWIWIFTNGAWAVYDFNIGAWEQAILFGAYFFLAIWGAWRWR